MKNIFEEVADLLLTNDKYKAEDGKLLKAVVYSDVMAMNEELLNLLLSSEDVKATFFKDVYGTLVFDKQKFAWFMESKEFLPDSYTTYTNKIGLTHNGNFISQTNDVVLDFPYKDCVLEGGQDKDDQKRDEIFYNETIASDEISRMLAPKVFTNAKRYRAVGEKDLAGALDPDTIHVEEETDITLNEDDNLIMKGNNLIALASLLKRYEGKVKCIYIDPPYNTQNDSFKYNDSFNHSTWLTFMKNRLELAKSLLSEDGVIFVQCDRNEFAELKLLLDETFQHSYLGTIVSISTPNGRDYGSFAQIHEYIHVFAKNIELVKTYSLEPDDLNKYSKKDNISNYYLHPLFNSNSAFHRGNRPNLFYPFYLSNEPNEHSYYSVSLTMDSRHTIEVYPPKSQTDNTQFVWRWGKDKALELANTELVGQKKSDGSFRIAQKMRPGKQIPRTVWQGAEYSNRRGTEELQTLFNKKVFAYPKPEELVKRILEIGTSEHDLVLDFHLGSGTTAAVAHKMGRRYIGVEQMDYIEDVTVARMKKVLEGEQGGISKTQNWTGGGSFVYCELKEDANTLIDTIQRATEDTIASIKASIYADDRVVPYLTKNELQDADKDFENLSLGDKKKVLITLIDKNKLYVNASDMVDENYHISDAEKAFTKSFYKEV